MTEGKAEELQLIKGNEHLWMNMIYRVKYKNRHNNRFWIQAYRVGDKLRLSSPYPKHFKIVKDYLVKMEIVKPKAL